MDIIVSTEMWKFALVHLDDVLIYLKFVEENLDNVGTLLGLL